MRITHIISDTNIGGAGVLLSSIIGGISKRLDTEVILPNGSSLSPRLQGLGARVTELPLSPDKSFSPKDTAVLYRYLSKNAPDILHSHASLSSRIAGRLLGIKWLISTRHCATGTPRRGGLSSMLYNRLTDLTVSTADFATENLISEGVPRERIVTIKNGSEKKVRLSPEERVRLRHRLSIPDGATVIGSCARLERVKGQDLILRAVKRLLPKYDLWLLIVGDGSERRNLYQLGARLGLLSRTVFTGFVSNPLPYQSIFDINVSASRGTETSCLATSECMSLGIPTVASDFGGNTEMIRDGVNGLIFESDDDDALSDALLRIIGDEALYSRLCQGALRVFSEEFTVGRMNESYLALYLGLA